MKVLKIMLAAAVWLCATSGFASSLEQAYKLHASEEAALKSVAGTQKHVLLFFTDSYR